MLKDNTKIRFFKTFTEAVYSALQTSGKDLRNQRGTLFFYYIIGKVYF